MAERHRATVNVSRIETTMGRYKALIGSRLRARGFAAQQTEVAIGVAVLKPEPLPRNFARMGLPPQPTPPG